MTVSTAGLGTVPIEMWSAIAGFVRRWAIAEFRIDGEPVSWERAGRNVEKKISYTPKAVRQAKRGVVAAFRAARPDWEPNAELAFGIYLELRAATLIHSDGDNKLKLIMDALNKVCWDDDWQVAEFCVRLDRGITDPHTNVIIYPAARNLHRRPRTRTRTTVQEFPVTPTIQRRVFNTIAAGLAARQRLTLGGIATGAGLATAAQAGAVVAALETGGFIGRDGTKFTIIKPFVKEPA